MKDAIREIRKKAVVFAFALLFGLANIGMAQYLSPPTVNAKSKEEKAEEKKAKEQKKEREKAEKERKKREKKAKKEAEKKAEKDKKKREKENKELRKKNKKRKKERSKDEEEDRIYYDKPFYHYYQEGEAYAKKNELLKAKDQFLISIKRRPVPSESVRAYGMNLIEYFPYLRLAEISLSLRQVEDARTYLAESENYGVAPPERIERVRLWLVGERKKPVIILYKTRDSTGSPFVDIMGIAFDAEEVVKVKAGIIEASIFRDAKEIDIQRLPFKPNLGFHARSAKYFEFLGYPLRLGLNRISIRAYAVRPDRSSDALELTVVRKGVVSAAPPPKETEPGSTAPEIQAGDSSQTEQSTPSVPVPREEESEDETESKSESE